jgi:hypothetical protein
MKSAKPVLSKKWRVKLGTIQNDQEEEKNSFPSTQPFLPWPCFFVPVSVLPDWAKFRHLGRKLS